MLMHQITSNVFSKYRCMQTKEIIENPNQILKSAILNKYDKLHTSNIAMILKVKSCNLGHQIM